MQGVVGLVVVSNAIASARSTVKKVQVVVAMVRRRSYVQVVFGTNVMLQRM